MNNPFTFEAEPFTSFGRPRQQPKYPAWETPQWETIGADPEFAEEFNGLDEIGPFTYVDEEAESGATAACPGYEKGEIETSHCQEGACQQGHLVTDVSWHQRGLLIADFGVGWSGIKAATKKEPLLRDWLIKAKADPHSIVLKIYGYSDCVGAERNNVALRSKRAESVYNLLDKALQSRVDFKGAARTGEYITDNKTKEARARNRSVIIEIAKFQETIHVKGTAPRPPPPPQPQPQPVQQRKWRLVGKFSWKGKKRHIGKRGYFEFYGEPEGEVTVSVNATDQEFLTFAGKWEKGKGPGGQFETKFEQWFVPDLKIEKGKDGLKISVKKGLKLLGEKLVVTPHLQLSTEVVKFQIDVLPFTVPVTLLGQDVRLSVKPRVNIIIKINLRDVLLDRLKKKLKDWLGELLKDLIGSLGRGLLGSLGRKVLAGLLGGVLAKLFLSSPPTTPVTAPPDDINGKDRALSLAGGSASALTTLQTWANTHRHAFAKAFADTLLELSRETWKNRLPTLRSFSINDYKGLPAAHAADRDWVVWTSTRKALQVVSIELPTDHFAKRFRWYELMLMFAVAAWILRKMTKAELDQAKEIALRQASIAGMAAAVQYVNRRIAEETFEYIDEQGRTQQANGIQRWDTVGALVRLSKLDDAELSKRLEQLGLMQLPGLPKTA